MAKQTKTTKVKKTHKTFMGKIFGSAWDAVKSFLHKLFEEANRDLLEFAILLTEAAKKALNAKALDLLTGITNTKVDDEIIKVAREKLPLLLAGQLAVRDLNAEPTEEGAKKLADDILHAFGGLDDKGKEKFYTSVAAESYILFMQVKEGKKVTWGQAAALVESAFQAWIKNKKA